MPNEVHLQAAILSSRPVNEPVNHASKETPKEALRSYRRHLCVQGSPVKRFSILQAAVNNLSHSQ